MNDFEQEQIVEEEEIHLRNYLRVVYKRRYVVGLFFLVTMLAVLLVTIRTTPIYEASVQMLVEKNNEATLVGPNAMAGSDPEFYETQRQLIISQNVARKVVALLDLEKKWKIYFPSRNNATSFIQTVKGWFSGFFSADTEQNVKSPAIPKVVLSEGERIAEILRGNIEVKSVKQSRVMNISFQSENPDFSRLVANTIADAYKEEVMAIQMDSSGYAMQWMTVKAEEQREKLAKAESALQQYMKKRDIVTIEDKVAVLPQQLSELTTKLAEAQAQKNVVGNIYRQIEEAKANKGSLETLSAVANHKEVQDISVNIRGAQQQISELSKKYGGKHPLMIEARGKLGEALRQKEAAINKIIGTIKNEYDMASAQEESLRSSLERIKGETIGLNEKMTEYNVLKRDVDTIRALYDTLILKAKEKGVTENTQKVNVWTTQVAQTPKGAIKPKPMRNMLLGVVLGLFGGIGCAFFVEYLDNTVKDPEESERRFGLSVMGVIELLKKEQNPDMEAVLEPTSSFAESYKSLRTSVLLSAADQPPKKLMITSMSPQEGKTTTAVNLARSLAQTDRRILLIDADLRRPRLHKVFQLENSVGLSSFLTGGVEELRIQLTETAGLSVLTSGPIPPNPSELLGAKRFAGLLERLEQEYDMVLIDSPPVLSATDSLLISKLASGVLVVCFTGKTTYERLQRGLKSLQEINSNVLGLVLNAMDMKKSNYYSYYGYYQYYSAGKEEKA